MHSRRAFLALVGTASAAFAAPARAFEFQPYDAAAVQKAIASGKPVVVHVSAVVPAVPRSDLDPRPPQGTIRLQGRNVLRVDYDHQKDVVAKLELSALHIDRLQRRQGS